MGFHPLAPSSFKDIGNFRQQNCHEECWADTIPASRTREPEAARLQHFTPADAGLFCFFVRGMLAAAIAKLREFQTACGRLFVLRRRVIALFACRTLQSNYFTHKPS